MSASVTAQEYRALVAKDRRMSARRTPGSMNGLETAYSQYLEDQRRLGIVRSWQYEALALRLGPGVRYTADFFVQMESGSLELHETKGFMREAARVRLRVAAAQYPCFRFVLVRDIGTKRARNWNFEEIAP